ncbi:MAG: hypothetical protein V9G12_25825 [Microthrixaceae bacterium]
MTDPDNTRFLDEIIPLWPNIGGAREFASKQVEAILRRIADIALDKHPHARAADELRAGKFLLAITGVRASDVASQEPVKRILLAPVNVNVVIGAMPATYPDVIDVIDGEARLMIES